MIRLSNWNHLLKGEYEIECRETNVTTDETRVRHLKTAIQGSSYLKNGKRWYERAPRSADHDAILLERTEQLVLADEAESHPFGHRYWFVTQDRHVAEVARAQVNRSAGVVCMLAEEWAQYIAPFLSPDVSAQDQADVFARLLASHFTRSLGESVSLEEIQPLTAANITQALGGVSRDDACRAVVELRSSGQLPGGRNEQPPEILLTRLNDLVERHRRRQIARGELISSFEAEAREGLALRDLGTARDELRERDLEIKRLRTKLDTADAYRRTSIKHWLKAARNFIVREATVFRHIFRGHRPRIVGALCLCAIGVLFIWQDWLRSLSDGLEWVGFSALLIGLGGWYLHSRRRLR